MIEMVHVLILSDENEIQMTQQAYLIPAIFWSEIILFVLMSSDVSTGLLISSFYSAVKCIRFGINRLFR
jgi:hypothetical protein